MSPKKITLEDLAEMTARGFSEIHNRIDGMEVIIQTMTTKDDLKEGLEDLEERLGHRLDLLEDRMQIVWTKLQRS